MKVYIASDHAGFRLKNFLIKNLSGIEFEDLGPSSAERVDYPDFASLVAEKVNSSEDMGILVCGSGQGMAMRANKYPNVRASLSWDTVSAALSRQHNNANILCLGERLIPFGLALEIAKTFFKTEFEGGRHASRVEKISKEIK